MSERFAGSDYVSWSGPGMLTRFDQPDHGPGFLLSGQHVVRGFRVASLPQPYLEPGRDVALGEVYDQHRERFFASMRRFLLGLNRAAMYREDPRDRLIPLNSIEIRFCASGAGSERKIEIYILYKIYVRFLQDRSEVERFAVEKNKSAFQLIYDLAPWGVELEQISGEALDQLLSVPEKASMFADLRRKNAFTKSPPFENYAAFRAEVEGNNQLISAPRPFSTSNHAMLMTCRSMMRGSGDITFAVRIQPTRLAAPETRVLKNIERDLANSDQKGGSVHESLLRILSASPMFQTCIQICGDDSGEVYRAVSSYSNEMAIGDWDTELSGIEHPARPARIQALTPTDVSAAKFNFTRMEFLPWGGISQKVAQANSPAGETVAGINLTEMPDLDVLWNPRNYLSRDVNLHPELIRLRSLFSFDETANIWKLPVASLMGPPGIQFSGFTTPEIHGES